MAGTEVTNEEYVASLVEKSSQLNKSVINTGDNHYSNDTMGISPTSINFSPLSTAALSNNTNLVRALLEVGANPNYKNKGTMSPRQCAKNNPQIQQLLDDPQYQDPTAQQNRTLKAVMEFREKQQDPSSSPHPTGVQQLQNQMSQGISIS